jgi:phosphoadenosine phosphosulfate reductase
VTKKADKARQHAARAQGLMLLARRRMERIANLSGGSILVGLSGGKDSLVTLDLCCRNMSLVEAYYMYLVPGLETFEAPVDAAAKRHGVKVHKVPHWELARLVKHAVLRPHTAGSAELRERKLRDVEDALRKQTGIGWFAMGERASDSFTRRFYTHKDDGVHVAPRRAFPIWDWLDGDVYSYLRVRKIQPPAVDDGFTKNRSSGFTLTGSCLSTLRRCNPDDYRRVLRMFPYAEAEVIKYENGQAAAESSCDSV